MKKQDWADEKVSFSINPIKSGPTLPGALDQILPITVIHIGPKLVGLYSLASKTEVFECRLPQQWYTFGRGCSLKLSLPLKEVTTGNQVLSRSRWHILVSATNADLLNVKC